MTQSNLTDDTSSNAFFADEELNCLDRSAVPRHVAIIPDGNRRWAREHHLAPEMGHHHGADCLIDIVKGAKDIGIEILTVYGFSTENNKRQAYEVEVLMFIMERYLLDKRQEMVENGIRCRAIGDTDALPPSLCQAIRETEAATAQCSDIDFVLALNYGGRDDIRRAIVSIVDDCMSGKISKEELSEKMIASYLDTADWPDPDLLIRTSGEVRISNFLLWQCSYTELYPVDIYWPDFTPQALLKAVVNYQLRNRRHGS